MGAVSDKDWQTNRQTVEVPVRWGGGEETVTWGLGLHSKPLSSSPCCLINSARSLPCCRVQPVWLPTIRTYRACGAASDRLRAELKRRGGIQAWHELHMCCVKGYSHTWQQTPENKFSKTSWIVLILWLVTAPLIGCWLPLRWQWFTRVTLGQEWQRRLVIAQCWLVANEMTSSCGGSCRTYAG